MKLKMQNVPYLLRFIFILYFITTCYASRQQSNASNDETPIKMNLVEAIVRKVCNLSLQTFSNKDPDEKAKLMIQIEEKLNKSARALGDHGIKYVKLIMEGVRSKAFDIQVNDSKNVFSNNIILRARTDKTESAKDIAISNPAKEELVKNITSKIEYLSKLYFHNATEEERKRAIENIRKKFIRTASQGRLKVPINHHHLNSYVNLVAKGIDAMMKNQGKTNNKRRNMEFVYTENFNLKKDTRKRLGLSIEPITLNANQNNDHGTLNKSKSKQISRKNDFYSSSKTTSLEASCDNAVKETCRKIKLVQMFQCLSDNREIPILKLCDGVGDCLDFSDEEQCALNAVGSIQSANRLMTHIESSLYQNCYSDLVDGSVIAKQHKIMSEALHNQLIFLLKYSSAGPSTYFRRVITTDADTVKKTVHEAVNIVNSLSLALNSSLCLSSRKDFKARRRGDDGVDNGILITEKEESVTSTWTPETCKCNGGNCNTVCSPDCEKKCWDKYSLSQLQCPAVIGEKLVSLDMICDGKLDCYDETDENDCSQDISIAKFEATQMYSSILNEISLKAASEKQDSARNKMINLHALVTKLQKLSSKRFASNMEIKRIREAAFSELSSIYETTLRYAHSPEDVEESYKHLKSLNVRLVSALKRSKAGNEKIISSDGCICRGYQCALPRCSKSCIRACVAEPKLTRYFCAGSSELNNSIPIELICNQKENCPNGDDEKDCKKDVCRAHHLKVLRHNIQDVGESQIGTALGESLLSWKVKVTSTLMIAENNDRPTPAVLRHTIRDILHDLVMSYATVEESRRSDHSTIFEEFHSLSRVLMDTLKSCGQ